MSSIDLDTSHLIIAESFRKVSIQATIAKVNLLPDLV